VFTVAYVVRAVSPGRYVHPQAYVEDMYRPDRFGRTATGRLEVTAAK
jgi:alpha-2-macroglobulin